MTNLTLKSNFAPLVAVIDATVGLQETATSACISEIRLKIEMLEMDAESFAALLSDVAAYKQFQRDSREFNVERMKAFSEFISSREQAMHAAALHFTESSDGTASCDCQAFRLTDESTIDEIRYAARYSGAYNSLWSAFISFAEDDPDAAFDALSEDDAAAQIRGWYAAKLEEKREAEKDAEKRESASGEAETVTLDEDAPDYLVELFNGCESLKRFSRAVWKTDADVASEILPQVTKAIHDQIAALKTAMESESEEVKSA